MNKVLIVEDDDDSRWALRNILAAERPDWILSEAASIESAKLAIKNDNPDAIITDWVFNNEEQCGRNILEYVQAHDPLIMVIVISAYEDRFDRYRDAFHLGAYDVIAKSHPAKTAYKEVILKLEVALRLRSLHSKSSFYSRHLDHNVNLAFERDPGCLVFQPRLVTIAFIDIRGFSALNKALLANNHLVADFLGKFYALVVETTHRFCGVVDKFMGDGAMLLFGAIRPLQALSDDGDRDALDAVSTCLDLRNGIGPLLSEFKKRFARAVPTQVPELALGMGLHTAEVLVGLIKTKQRDQFTALGHGVNLAQRFESAAGRLSDSGNRYGDILISKTVKERVEEHVILKFEGDLKELKNINESHPAWSVEGLRSPLAQREPNQS